MILSWPFLLLFIATVKTQLLAPPGKTPAIVLSKRILPNGDIEVAVPYSETFVRNGERVAYVSQYQCVRTLFAGGRARQYREKCIPRVEIIGTLATSEESPQGITPTTTMEPLPTTTTAATTTTTAAAITAAAAAPAAVAAATTLPSYPHVWPYPWPYPYPYVTPLSTTTTPQARYIYPPYMEQQQQQQDSPSQSWYLILRRIGYPDYVLPYPSTLAGK
ncbi:uncharacterized protein LOC111265799 isoform X1 [Varroa jacobsoni]|uniref:uncharacterized protein LOC111265799 isoform X1 n=1 Tax=Varroa jacobsoni TaxID=62625 RepID=UPI000BF9B419|nr:uncharacterized protein LOC111265799 isoform X1 [Varroa jacobsoni]